MPQCVSQAPEAVQDSLLAGFSPQKADKEQVLVREAELWRSMVFVDEGLVRLFYSDLEGREFNKGFFREGELVLPMAPSARTEASLFTVATLEASELLVADYWHCRRLLEAAGLWAEFALPFAEGLADEKFRREYEFLVYSPEERYRRFHDQNPWLADRVPDYHLASYLGMTAVSYSRMKRRERLNTR